MKISYQFLVDKFLNRNNISLYIFSKPRYNKSILLNVDNSKDVCIKKKKFKLMGFFLVFLGPHPRHMDNSRLHPETPDPSCIFNIYQSSLQHHILNTLSGGPGINPMSSWILIGFLTTEPLWELPT